MYSNNSAYIKTIDTLTEISNKIIEQKFYTIKNIPDFVKIEKGVGGVADSIMNWATFDNVGSFEDGNFGSNGDFERTASADVLIDNKTFFRQKWKKSVSYNLMDVKQADRAKVINIVEGKEKARKKNWDLGLQEIIFIGSKINTKITGLLNNADVNVDATTITKKLSAMSETEFNTFIATIPNKFFVNSNFTGMFNRFVIPTDDYNALVSQMSPTYPIKTKLQVLQDAFSDVLSGYGVNDFKVLPCAYCNKEKNPQNKNVYALYNNDIDVLTYDLALDYTTTAFNTYNNFDFSNIAYGMYGSVNVLRPAEMMYFSLS